MMPNPQVDEEAVIYLYNTFSRLIAHISLTDPLTIESLRGKVVSTASNQDIPADRKAYQLFEEIIKLYGGNT